MIFVGYSNYRCFFIVIIVIIINVIVVNIYWEINFCQVLDVLYVLL